MKLAGRTVGQSCCPGQYMLSWSVYAVLSVHAVLVKIGLWRSLLEILSSLLELLKSLLELLGSLLELVGSLFQRKSAKIRGNQAPGVTFGTPGATFELILETLALTF